MANFNLDNYVPVADRITKFYKDFPNGRINTQLISDDNGTVIFKASVYRQSDDAEPSGTGHASETLGDGYVNKTSHVENAETSSVGRALAMLGYEIKTGVASREEMQKVERKQTQKQTAPTDQDAKKDLPLKQRIDNAIMAVEAFQVRALDRKKGQSDEEYFAALETQYKQIRVSKGEVETTDALAKPIKPQQLASLEKLCPMKGVEPSEVAGKYSDGRTDKLSELYEHEAGTALKEVSAIKE